MRVIISTIVLCFSLFTSFGQNQLKLDNELGFDKFRLETPKNHYRKLKFIRKESNSFCKVYEYRKGDLLFDGIPIYVIKLRFYRNSLYHIQLIIQSNKKDYFLDFLTNRYGNFNGFGAYANLSGGRPNDFKEWLAEMVELQYVKTEQNHFLTFFSTKVYELKKDEIQYFYIFQ